MGLQDKIIIGGLTIFLIAVFTFFAVIIGQSSESGKACNDAGGVPLRGYCISQDAIIDVEKHETSRD